MKILIFGNFFNGNVASEIEMFFMKQSLKVYRHNRHSFFKLSNNIFFNKGLVFFFSPIIELILNITLIIKYFIYNPNIFFVIKGLNIYPSILKYISKRAVCINWNLDDFHNPKNSNKNLIKTIKLYDLIISPKIELFDKYIKEGAKKLLFLENFYFEKYFYPEKSKKKYNISFIGSWSKKRDKLINIITEKHMVHVFGNSWIHRNKNERVIKHNEISPDKYREVVSQSRINLNFLTDDNNDTSNLRFFEISACNGLLLNEYSDRLGKILLDKSETFYFKNISEINCVVDEILKLKEQEVIKIKNAANRKIRGYSFENTCKTILLEIKKIKKRN